ncbi:MAG: NRDE family protein [Syntrophaceae bacterium]
MCLILLSYRTHEKYPVVLAANRDEFYERPSAPVSLWDDVPDVIAGRDLKSGGTWLGITKQGRLAAVTNYREPESHRQNAPSRGWLVKDFLCSQEEPKAYLEKTVVKKEQYNGFNLILGDMSCLYYFSNRGSMCELSPSLYGLSNRLLNTPWPKVEKGKKAFELLLSGTDNPRSEDIFTILSDKSKPDDSKLPDTGIGLEWERILSSIFITSPVYGTRSSSVIMVDRKNHVMFIEKVFDTQPEPWMVVKFDFSIYKEFDQTEKKECGVNVKT